MTMTDELIEQFNRLDEAQQQRLLNFARILTKTPKVQGEPGTRIVQAVGFFDAQALDEIEAAINEGTEDIDWRGWE
ncbi:MAG: hypothetical protein KME04_20795 [Pleurocapsa minor GSE-CHR-MK-17-07R]|nr:hypothetical protein [Pleurocapsa minor GSE-CHR-MK 17-07R]